MFLRVESTRGGLVESVHRVSLAVVDDTGKLLALGGDPDLVTFWRSAAKPFQALPLVADGAADRWGFSEGQLAVACASHSSEPIHLAMVTEMLERVGMTEADLACGAHPPLTGEFSGSPPPPGRPSPRWSNCSGKHAGMLALARHHGWPVSGYERQGHPAQERILDEVERWTGVSRGAIGLGVDGCTAVSYALPLRAMATAYARLAVSPEPAATRIRAAMMGSPRLVAGTGRLCTDLMAAYPGAILAKVGAEGIYCVALPPAGIGLALKVEDGDSRSAPIALLAALHQLAESGQWAIDPALGPQSVTRHAELPSRNTRRRITGALTAAGGLRFPE